MTQPKKFASQADLEEKKVITSTNMPGLALPSYSDKSASNSKRRQLSVSFLIRQAELTALAALAYDSRTVQAESWASWRPSVHAPDHVRHGKASSFARPLFPAQ